MLADFLVVDVTKPYVEGGSFLEIELAALRGAAHETCGGRTLNDDVMDTALHAARERRERADHPRWRRRVDAAGVATFPYLAEPNPDPPKPPEHHCTDEGDRCDDDAATPAPLELDDIQSGALHERPSPYVGAYLLLRIDDRAAGRELVRRLHPAGRVRARVGRPGARRLASRSPSPTRA